MLAGGQTTESLVMDGTTNDNEITSETAETTSVTVTTSDGVTSMYGFSTEVSTSEQLLTSDMSSSLIPSVTTGDAATTTELTTATTTTTMSTMTRSETTTAEIRTTTEEDATSTRQKTTTSQLTPSGLTTVAETTVTKAPPEEVHCCCRCCFPSTNACKVCDGDTLTDASKCANEKSKTVKQLDRNTPNFERPEALKGSQHPERLALREDFLKTEHLTENLASLSDSQRIDLGFKSSDLIVDCFYDGKPCSVEQLVETSICFLCTMTVSLFYSILYFEN